MFVVPDHERARALAFEALDLADQAGDRELRIWARASAGELAPDGDGERSAQSLLAEAAELEQDGPLTPSAEGCPSAILGRMLTFRDQVEEARQLLEQTITRARAEGDERGAAMLAIHLAEADVRAGRIAEARAVVDDALSLLQLGIDNQVVSAALYARALGAAHAGDEEAARAAASESLEMLERLGDQLFPLQLRAVLGFLEMSRGHAAAALVHLEGLPAAVDAVGRGAWRPIVCHAETIEALIGVGRNDEARQLLAAWEARGDGSLRVAATAARARALLAAQEGDLDAALLELDAAREHHDGLPVPLERARTLIVRGIVLRRAGRRRDARAALEEAREICEAIGARLWAARCDNELARLGGRAPSRDALTPTEQRVADLVVAGHTNREVAEALFVTVRTVEANLTRIYAKLGVRSRTEMAALSAPR
jgi:DNA-binding CsgD family transcriptional regulator